MRGLLGMPRAVLYDKSKADGTEVSRHTNPNL